MKCPVCGNEMGKSAKCLRCGYTIKAVIPVDPEKIEKESEHEPKRKEINPDDVHVSRAGGGGLFGDLFGGGLFGGFGGLFGDLFGGFDIFDGDQSDGYEYDPKYYDDFGNEIHVPDEFERETVEIDSVEYLENPTPKAKNPEHRTEHKNSENAEHYNTNKFRKHKHRHNDNR